MYNTVSIASRIGSDLRIRSFFRRDIEHLLKGYQDHITLNFEGVVFISRSVADEICNLQSDYPDLQLTGMEGDVEKMYNVVNKGRKKAREYPTMNPKIHYLKSFKEMIDFFAAL